MALPKTLAYTVKSVGLAAASPDGFEHVMLEPVGGDGTVAGSAPIKLVLNTAGLQGLFTAGDAVNVTFAAG